MVNCNLRITTQSPSSDQHKHILFSTNVVYRLPFCNWRIPQQHLNLSCLTLVVVRTHTCHRW